MDEKRLLIQVIAAARAGQRAKARRLLQEALALNPRSEIAWLWLSTVVESDIQRVECLQRVLRINPDNDTAREKLSRLKTKPAAAPYSQNVEQALQDQQPGQSFNSARKTAAKRLGQLDTSDLRIVSAPIAAVESAPSSQVRKVPAAESLEAPVHQEILQQHPDLTESATLEVEPYAPEWPPSHDCEYEFINQESTMREHERYHLKEAISTVVCFVGGLILMTSGGGSSNAALHILGGLTLMGLSVAAFIITEGWRYMDDLPDGEKMIAQIPAAIGKIMAFAVFFILRFVGHIVKGAIEENM